MGSGDAVLGRRVDPKVTHSTTAIAAARRAARKWCAGAKFAGLQLGIARVDVGSPKVSWSFERQIKCPRNGSARSQAKHDLLSRLLGERSKGGRCGASVTASGANDRE